MDDVEKELEQMSVRLVEGLSADLAIIILVQRQSDGGYAGMTASGASTEATVACFPKARAELEEALAKMAEAMVPGGQN